MVNTTPRAVARLGGPVSDPAAWTRTELQATTSWCHVLDDQEIQALLQLSVDVRRRIGNNLNQLIDMGRDAFGLGAFGPTMASIRTQLKDGFGVSLIRGLPLDEIELIDAAIIYWAMGSYLGQARSNNPQGDLFGHITDLGLTQKDAKSRGYQTSEAMDYHCDQTSIVGLLCVQEPQLGGISKIASSVSVYNELVKRSPESVALLSEPMYWTKHGEVDPEEAPYYCSAVFSVLEGLLCTSYGPNHIAKGHALEGVPALTDAQRQALDLVRTIAEEQHYAMELKRGDIQFLNNFVTLHTRTAYVDRPGLKRLLWRLWLSDADLRPYTDYVKQWDRGVHLASTHPRIVI